jgi:hypothetical protein
VSILVAGCIEPTTPSDKKVASPIKVPTTVTAASTTVDTLKTTPVPTLTPSFNHYSNSRFGFSIDYPGDWEKNELNEPEPEISLTRYKVVEFYSPSFVRCDTEKNKCVNVRSEVTIEVDTNPVSTELDTFFVKEVARVSTERNVEITKRNAMFKLSDNRAYRFDYNSQSDIEDINVLSALTIINGTGYIITFHAHVPERNEKINQFEQYYNDIITMFSSFKATTGNYKTI